MIESCEPNSAHCSLAQMDCWIITQNIDNFHEKAGTKNIYHIHGDLFSCKCENVNRVILIILNLEINVCCAVED